MANSYVSCLMHVIYSTKNRMNLITPDLEERLWPYLGGIAKANDIVPLAIGGTTDHVHLFLSLNTMMPVGKAVQLIKGGSTRWVHETMPRYQQFGWQDGYSAFGVSPLGKENLIAYIRDQKAHHQRHTFQEEYRAFLDRYGMAYDERYLWG